MSITCHVLPYEIAEGPANMALDETLLESVSSGTEVAYLRSYGWLSPTLSLGYFQRLAEAEPRWHEVPLVRRATGGGAIWHHRELTYAVVLPSRHPHARPSKGLYRIVHAAIADVLREQGVDAQRRKGHETEPAQPGQSSQSRPFLCFTDRDPEDIVSGGFKIVGSAQRRRAGAILQHGSILLKACERTPELRGACDLAEVSPDPGFWVDRVQLRIAQALGLKTLPCEPIPAVRRRAWELEYQIYRNAAWTRRR